MEKIITIKELFMLLYKGCQENKKIDVTFLIYRICTIDPLQR